MDKNCKALLEDLLFEKQELLKKLETNGTHALRIKALKSEMRRIQRVLDGKPYDRKHKKEESN
jgi:chromosome segregation ATPase